MKYLITALLVLTMQCEFKPPKPRSHFECTYEDQFGVQTIKTDCCECKQRTCINEQSNIDPIISLDGDIHFSYSSGCVEYARLVKTIEIKPEVK